MSFPKSQRMFVAVLKVLLGVILGGLFSSYVAGCGAGGSAGSGGANGFISGNGVITWLPITKRAQVGTVTGRLLDGKPFDLAQLRGKVIVINVWGSWCAPCRSEAPRLQSAYQQLSKRGVVFVGINTRDANPTNGLAFERTFKVTYPSLYDPDGQTLLAFGGRLSPSAIPTTIVLDQQGRIAASVAGEVSSSVTLVDLVDDVIKGRAGIR